MCHNLQYLFLSVKKYTEQFVQLVFVVLNASRSHFTVQQLTTNMGAYKYLEEIWRKKQSDVMRFLLRVRAWQYRQEKKIQKISKPSRTDKAHKLGYKVMLSPSFIHFSFLSYFTHFLCGVGQAGICCVPRGCAPRRSQAPQPQGNRLRKAQEPGN